MFTLALLACAPDPGAGKPKATVIDVPTTPAEVAPAPVAGGALAAPPLADGLKALPVDKAKSELGAVGAKITATHPISFPVFEGTVGVQGDDVKAVSFIVDMAALESSPARLTGHLKNEDFFDVAKYPTASFSSVSITPSTAGGGTHEIQGDLTIHGKTKRVGFPATLASTAGEVSAKTEFTVDRRDFDVVYPGKPDDLVKDSVLIKVSLVAPRS